MNKSRVLLVSAAMLLAPTLAVHAATPPKPVEVFILAGQSNMEGQAVVDLDGKDYNDGKGTLVALMAIRRRPQCSGICGAATASGRCARMCGCAITREQGPLLAGPLAIGFSVYGDTHHFGPELQFGHVVGQHFDQQVLLIKTAWGGKSLYQEFRPPSSGGEVGPYYTKMLGEIHAALANLKHDFPGYQGQGYELAGFVWYQTTKGSELFIK